jgi:hypothetical protein
MCWVLRSARDELDKETPSWGLARIGSSSGTSKNNKNKSRKIVARVLFGIASGEHYSSLNQTKKVIFLHNSGHSGRALQPKVRNLLGNLLTIFRMGAWQEEKKASSGGTGFQPVLGQAMPRDYP